MSSAPSAVRVQTLRPIMLLSTAAFCASTCLRITDPLLPELATAFGVTTSRASVIVTAFALAYGLAQIIYGPIGDRFGKYSVITLAVTLSATGIAAALPLDVRRQRHRAVAGEHLPECFGWKIEA